MNKPDAEVHSGGDVADSLAFGTERVQLGDINRLRLAPEMLSLRLGIAHTSLDALDNRGAFQFSESAHYGHHALAHRAGRIDRLSKARELNIVHLQDFQDVEQVRYRTRHAVELPNDDGIKESSFNVGHQAVEFGTAGLRAADSGINEFANDLPAAPGSVLSQFAQLHLCRLIGSANSRIQSGFHRFTLAFRGLPPFFPFSRAAAALAFDVRLPSSAITLAMSLLSMFEL